LRLYLEPSVLVKLFKTELNTEQMIEIIDAIHVGLRFRSHRDRR